MIDYAIHFHSLKKISKHVNVGGDCCMAITVLLYFIVIEH